MRSTRKRFAVIFLSFVVCLVTCLYPVTWASADEPTGTISGKVSLPEGRAVPEENLSVKVLII